jgi:hypothetical protein
MKRLIVVIAAVVLPMFYAKAAISECGIVDNNLRITLPCAEYAGVRLQVVLDYYPNPSDNSSVYWRLSTAAVTMTPVCGDCATVGSSLNIVDACVYFAGNQYQLSLDYYYNSADPSGAYWKLNSVDALSVAIQQVTGATMECYDIDDYMVVANCILSCGADPQCMMNCIGGGFSLAVEINNLTTSDFLFSIPGGITFVPESSDLQTMMALDECLTVPPGAHTFCIPSYCLNADLGAPDTGDGYAVGGPVETACLQEIASLTHGKTIDFQAIPRIQNIVWDCVEDGNISSEDRAYLESL